MASEEEIVCLGSGCFGCRMPPFISLIVPGMVNLYGDSKAPSGEALWDTSTTTQDCTKRKELYCSV